MKGVKTYTREVEGEEVQMFSVKGTVTSVAPYNDKSIRFVATSESDLGDIAGFRALSIEEESGAIKVGDKLTFSTEAGYLTGENTDDGKPANFLWSTSRGGADELSNEQVDAIKALLAK